MVFEKERQLNFLDMQVKSLIKSMGECSTYTHMHRDGVDSTLSQSVEAGYITHEEFDDKYWRSINNAGHKFIDNCRCGIIKK